MAITNINQIPGLAEEYNKLIANPQTRNQAIALATQAMANPVKYVENTLSNTILNDNTLNNNFANTSKSVQFLKDNGVSSSEIKSSYDNAWADAQRSLLESQNRSDGFFNTALSIAAAYFAPGAGEILGAALGIGTTAGTILAQAAAGAAQGQDFQTALQNAAVSSVVNTGSTDAAKAAVQAGTDPAMANALASAGGSIAKTVAAGGSSDDILKNVTAALAGSGVATATGDKVLGSAAGGAVTGGALGAATGAAGALGQPSTTPTTTVSSSDQQVIDAFSKSQSSQDLASMIDSANLTPEEREFLKSAQQATFTAASTAQALPSVSDAGAGVSRSFSPFAANDPRFISAMQKNPELLSKFSEYTNSYGFNTPALNVVYQKLLEDELQKDPTYQPLLDEYKKITGQDYVASPGSTTDLGTINVTSPKITSDSSYTPTIISPGDVTTTPSVTSPTTTPAPTITPVTQPTVEPGIEPVTQPGVEPGIQPAIQPGTQPASQPATQPVAQPAVSPATPSGTGTTAPSALPSDTTTTPKPVDVISGGGGNTTSTIVKTDDPISSIAPSTPVDKVTISPGDEGNVTSTYRPELFIYGGISPTLSRALRADFQSGGTPSPTTGLTSYRGAGEIEAEAGTERKNVWNEASLRLKDALGI